MGCIWDDLGHLGLMFFSPSCNPTCSHHPRVIFMLDLYSRTYSILVYIFGNSPDIYRTTRGQLGPGRRLITDSCLVGPMARQLGLTRQLDNIDLAYTKITHKRKETAIYAFSSDYHSSTTCLILGLPFLDRLRLTSVLM